MNALRRLENGGIRLWLTPEGRIAYENAAPGGVPPQWAARALAELRREREEAVAVLRAREAWLAVHDEWATAGDDPARDAATLRRLEALAVAAEWPCYDGGPVDLGPAGWRRVTERMIEDIYRVAATGEPAGPKLTVDKEIDNMGIRIEQTVNEAVPTGEYRAIISEISPDEGKFGPQLRIKCEINAGPFAGTAFLSWVSVRFSPRSRLYEWVEAALASPVPRTYTFDSDHLLGREVLATLVVRALEGGGEVNRVDRVRAVSGRPS